MKNISRILFPLVIICSTAWSSVVNMRSDVEIKGRIDSLVNNYMRGNHIVGLSLGIVYSNQVYYLKGYGSGSATTISPVDSLTNFHLASVSKTFVGVAILQLQEQGKLNIDDKFIKYLPDVNPSDDRFKDITLRQMLSHTSGIKDESNYHWSHPCTDSLALYNYAMSSAKMKLAFDPGTKFSYSNRAFEMLGYVIERVSGQLFEDYMDEHVLRPVGMGKSSFNYNRIDVARRSKPHVRRLGRVKVSGVYPYNRQHGPSSTLNSCSADMVNWMMELNRIYSDSTYKGIISHESLREMWAPQFRFDSESYVGFSWGCGTTTFGLMAAHTGRDVGYTSQLVMFPDFRMGIILMVNGDYGNGEEQYDLVSSIALLLKAQQDK